MSSLPHLYTAYLIKVQDTFSPRQSGSGEGCECGPYLTCARSIFLDAKNECLQPVLSEAVHPLLDWVDAQPGRLDWSMQMCVWSEAECRDRWEAHVTKLLSDLPRIFMFEDWDSLIKEEKAHQLLMFKDSPQRACTYLQTPRKRRLLQVRNTDSDVT